MIQTVEGKQAVEELNQSLGGREILQNIRMGCSGDPERLVLVMTDTEGAQVLAFHRGCLWALKLPQCSTPGPPRPDMSRKPQTTPIQASTLNPRP